MFNFKDCPYKIRYSTLDSSMIFNFLEPSESNIEHLNKRTGFYKKIEESIVSEGVRNPIMIWSISKSNIQRSKGRYISYKVGANVHDFAISRIPLEFQNLEDILVCRTHGGSRLYVAQKHKLEIPCIISDFNSKYSHLETLCSDNEIMSKFKDKPKKVSLTKNGVVVLQLPRF